jgi:hypothetical protein
MRLIPVLCLLFFAPVLAAEVTDAEMEELVAIWRKYRMPEPPKDAPLTVLTSTTRYVVRDGESLPQPHYAIAWRLSDPGEDRTYLHGTRVARHVYGLGEELDPELLESEPVEAFALADLDSTDYFKTNKPFASAVLLWMNGRKEFAKKLMRLTLKNSVDSGQFEVIFRQPATDSPRDMLASLMWAHWGNELVEPASDRAEIYQLMQQSFDEFAVLREEYTGPEREAFLNALKATIAPITAEPGTVEYDVAMLREVRGPDRYNRTRERDQRSENVLLRGFDAVPELIRSLDDKRLTRVASQAFMKVPARIRTVGELAYGTLIAISAGSLQGRSRLDRKQAAEEWWAAAQEVGERAYLEEKLGDLDDKFTEGTLRIIAGKYPDMLLEQFLKALESDTPVPHVMHELLAESSLPNEQKVRAFRKGAGSPDLGIRRASLHQLHNLNDEMFVDILVETLDSFGEKASGPAFWTTPEAGFTHLVLLTEDQRAWDALTRATQRAEVGLRMEYMRPMNSSYVADRLLTQRLTYLAHFLDDEVVRVKSGSRYRGPHAAFTFQRIRVCDFAAMQIASILGIRPGGREDWSEDQWQDLHTRVLEQLAQRNIEVPDDD